MMRRLALTAALLLSGLASAQTLRVDSEGGPLTLEGDLEVAIEAWSEAGDVPVDLALRDDGDIAVRYARDFALGPDTLSLTLQTPQTEGPPRVEIVLNPGRYRSAPATLLHELGVLLGLQPGDDPDSVMRPALQASGPDRPGSIDIERLAALRNAVPEDVDRNGVVDFYDLAALAEAFGDQGINLPADIDRDGRVDEADLERLREAYVFGEPSPTPPVDTAVDEDVVPPALPDVPGAPPELPPDEVAPPPGDDTGGEGELPAAPPDDDETPPDGAP